MEHLVSNLKENKVTLSINVNEFQERYVYDYYEDKFSKIEDLGSLFKELKHHKPQAVLEDIFGYSILFYKENTVSLFKIDDKNERVKEFKETITKEIPMHIKELGFTRKRITADDIMNQKELFYEYVARLHGLSVVIDNKIYGDGEVCLVCSNNPEITERGKWLESDYKNKCEKFKEESLSGKLVSELKAMAESIGCVVHKIVDNKKKPLLKAELIDVINKQICKHCGIA